MKKSPGFTLPVVGITLLLWLLASSFTALRRGGEGFEIHLNQKLLAQRFGSAVNQPPQITLTRADEGGLLSITYYHCGQAAGKRVLSLQDDQGRTLREWKYADAGRVSSLSGERAMGCKLSDLLPLLKRQKSPLRLCYQSAALSLPRIVAVLNWKQE